MISASHNQFYDNGIKIINSRGEKISDDFINKIEDYIDNAQTLPYAAGEDVGRIIDYSEGRNRYIGYLISLSKFSFKGYRVGLDCANGSAWMIAKSVFEALGAKVYAIGVSPNGTNINRDVGSTNIHVLAKYVLENKLDIGFAFDGDADRCIAVDENGDVISGDHILYLLSKQMRESGELAHNTVVTTVMSNLGLYKALESLGIKYETTSVGDRYVYERMHEGGYSLGGEQSGHIIIAKYATTGDGIVTAIKVMETIISSKTALSNLAKEIKMFPQLTVNVRVNDKNTIDNNEELRKLIKKIQAELSDNGRILVRPSGTEPVIRIMVEASDYLLCQKYSKTVENKILSLEV
jgi:phosphoglucosamine mutase